MVQKTQFSELSVDHTSYITQVTSETRNTYNDVSAVALLPKHCTYISWSSNIITKVAS